MSNRVRFFKTPAEVRRAVMNWRKIVIDQEKVHRTLRNRICRVKKSPLCPSFKTVVKEFGFGLSLSLVHIAFMASLAILVGYIL